jgi:lauroyl/myristoyl acyltransferase
MTMAAPDALHTLSAVFAHRPLIAYGEDGVPRHGTGISVVNGDVRSIRHIIKTLAGGGAFCTYADFVYAGRDAEPSSLFGRPRPISSGFLTLASRPGTMLLPAMMRLTEDQRVAMEFDEPFVVHGTPQEARAARGAVRALIAELLEELVRRNPQQWLLLPTLSYDCPQLATT